MPPRDYYEQRSRPSSRQPGISSSNNRQTGQNNQNQGNTGRERGIIASQPKPIKVKPVTQAQQDERDWAGEFSGTVTKEAKDAYAPWKSSVTGLKTNQPYTYKTQAEIDRERERYQSETSMKEGIESALGGLDYSSWDDPDKSREDWGLKDGRLWDPFVKGYDPKGNPIEWTDDDIRNVFMRGEFGFPNYPTISQGGGGSGGWSGWGSGGGGGGGGGYGGYGMAGGPTPEQMAGFYTPQANLQQAMINVHQTPTVFKKRGGIVSLLELR